GLADGAPQRRVVPPAVGPAPALCAAGPDPDGPDGDGRRAAVLRVLDAALAVAPAERARRPVGIGHHARPAPSFLPAGPDPLGCAQGRRAGSPGAAREAGRDSVRRPAGPFLSLVCS